MTTVGLLYILFVAISVGCGLLVIEADVPSGHIDGIPVRSHLDEDDSIHSIGRELSEKEKQLAKNEFDEYDSNRDGLLDAFEVRLTHNEITKEELVGFFESVDRDENGLISFDEYIHYLQVSG